MIYCFLAMYALSLEVIGSDISALAEGLTKGTPSMRCEQQYETPVS